MKYIFTLLIVFSLAVGINKLVLATPILSGDTPSTPQATEIIKTEVVKTEIVVTEEPTVVVTEEVENTPIVIVETTQKVTPLVVAEKERDNDLPEVLPQTGWFEKFWTLVILAGIFITIAWLARKLRNR